MAEIVFNEERHEYHVGGVQFPSVTQVLDPLLELEGIPRAALEAAAHFGTHVHLACHLWDRGELDEEALDPRLAPYLEGWKSFLRETGVVVLSSELRVAHPTLRYAGGLDKVILWKRRSKETRHVLDLKSGALVPPTVGPQTAAYREAYLTEELVCSPTRYCVHLRADGTYRLHTLEDRADFNLFLSALNIHHWRARNARR